MWTNQAADSSALMKEPQHSGSCEATREPANRQERWVPERQQAAALEAVAMPIQRPMVAREWKGRWMELGHPTKAALLHFQPMRQSMGSTFLASDR
jgi:hypothetical protein